MNMTTGAATLVATRPIAIVAARRGDLLSHRFLFCLASGDHGQPHIKADILDQNLILTQAAIANITKLIINQE